MSGVPASLVLDLFNREMKKQQGLKPTLRHYALEFVQFLEEHKDQLNFPRAEKTLIYNYLKNLFNRLYENVKVDMSPEKIYEHVEKSFENLKDKLTQQPKKKSSLYVLDWELVEQQHQEIVKETYRYWVGLHFKKNFKVDGFSETDQKIIGLLSEAASLAITTIDFFRPYVTGFCFAGYGTTSPYPAAYEFNYYGFAQGRVLYEVISDISISDTHPRSVITLAQDDVILSLIRGIDNRVESAIKRQLSSKTKEFFEKEISSQQSDKTNPSNTKPLYDKFHDQVIKGVGAEQEVVNNADKILTSIQLLPLIDLAVFAENLISIQILKRKYELDSSMNGTVGGPIRVVTITKTDGVFWRK
jgi:hypothetical protein